MDEPLCPRESPHYFRIIYVLIHTDMFKSKMYYVLWTVSMCTTSFHSKFSRIIFGYEFTWKIWMDYLLQIICLSCHPGLSRPWCHIYKSTSKVQKGTRIGHSVGELSIIHIRLVMFGEYRSVCTQARSLAHLASPLLMPFITDMHSYIYLYYDYFFFGGQSPIFGNYKVCSHFHNQSLISELVTILHSSTILGFCLWGDQSWPLTTSSSRRVTRHFHRLSCILFLMVI